MSLTRMDEFNVWHEWHICFDKLKKIFTRKNNLSISYEITHKHRLTYNNPKYSEWNLALDKLEEFFPLKYAIILSFGKRLNN